MDTEWAALLKPDRRSDSTLEVALFGQSIPFSRFRWRAFGGIVRSGWPFVFFGKNGAGPVDKRRFMRIRKGPILSTRPQPRHQVPDDQYVYYGDRQLRHREMPGDLDDFERNEEAGGNGGEVFRPALAQQQSGAFSGEKARIDEGAHAQLPQLPRSDAQYPGQQSVNVPVVRVRAEHLCPVRYRAGQVPVQESDCADPYRDKQDGLYQLEYPDEDQDQGR